MLEAPGIWDHALVADQDQKDSGADQWLTDNVFTDDFLGQLLKQVTIKFLILSEDEVELWKEDSLKYFIDMKEESNETKGNYLRGKANRVIAGISLRFEKKLKAFCSEVLPSLKSSEDI